MWKEKQEVMVLLLLEIKAELENVTALVPSGGSDGSEYTFFFKVCTSARYHNWVFDFRVSSFLCECLPAPGNETEERGKEGERERNVLFHE